MEEKERLMRRSFTPEQKFEIVKDIERHTTLKEGLEKQKDCRLPVQEMEKAAHGWCPCIDEKRKTHKLPPAKKTRRRKQEAKRGRTEPVIDDHQPKKRDELGLGQGHILEEQKRQIIKFVNEQKAKGYTVTDTLKDMGIKRSTYYFWCKPAKKKPSKRINELTPYEKSAIEQIKEEYPHLRHRQIQGILQQKGMYLSQSSIYHHMKSLNMVEPYERRPSPLKEPRYSIWQRNLMWGCDWTRLLINHVRWYLIILIDFFSRYIISYGIFPSINASHVKHIYRIGLKEQGIRKAHDILPELRVDSGSPNTSLVTKEFFEIIGAELSFARTRRPTDNAFTERFFGTAKQEEIYLVGSYPDECSAWEEMGSYIYTYNHERPLSEPVEFYPFTCTYRQQQYLITGRAYTIEACNTITEKRVLGAAKTDWFGYKRGLTKLCNFV